MYNEEQKNRYLDDVKYQYSREYLTNLVSLFNKTEQFEEMFGKDVSEFSREDISNMYAFVRYSDAYTYSNVNSRLAAYCSWCNDHTLVADGCNHFKEIVFSDFNKYINKRLEQKKYVTREELLGFIKNIVNPRDQFIFLCLFEFGKSDNFLDILKMKISDIDENTNTVKLNSGKVVNVSDKLISLAHEANEEMVYYFAVSERTRNYMPSPYIVKLTNVSAIGTDWDNDPMPNRGTKIVARIIANNVDLLEEYNGINAASLAVSGQIEMISRRSAELGISKRDYILNHFGELERQYNLSPNNPRNYFRKYEAYL